MQPHVHSEFLPDETATLAFGQALAEACGGQNAWIYLSGRLGAGKTTLIRGFLRALGYQGRVKSPTYTLVEPYEISVGSHVCYIYHFDFYRINQVEELAFMGIEEYFQAGNGCLVEWPEHASWILPTADVMVEMTPRAEGRQIHLEGTTPRGVDIIRRLTHA